MRTREYKVKNYGEPRDYKITHQPKYHEYTSHHEYDKIRNYSHRDYKPVRLGYHGYKATKTKRISRPKPRQKHVRHPRPERWPLQIKHCYEKPGGPEYPIAVYKQRDYKPKPYHHNYREYNTNYTPYHNYQEYKGNVHYQLTPQNYYGFRRGNRVYKPATSNDLERNNNISKPETKIKDNKHVPTRTVQKKTETKPKTPKKIATPASVVVATLPVQKRQEKTVINGEDNGLYKSRDYTSNHDYKHVYEYNSYKPYVEKPYDHHFEYTSKESLDGNPHTLRVEEPVIGQAVPRTEARVLPANAFVSARPTPKKETRSSKTDVAKENPASVKPLVQKKVESHKIEEKQQRNEEATVPKSPPIQEESRDHHYTPFVATKAVSYTPAEKTPSVLVRSSNEQTSISNSTQPVVAATFVHSAVSHTPVKRNNPSNKGTAEKTVLPSQESPKRQELILNEPVSPRNSKQNTTGLPLISVVATSASKNNAPLKSKTEPVTQLPKIPTTRTPSPKPIYATTSSPEYVPKHRRQIQTESHVDPGPVVLPLIPVPAPVGARPNNSRSNRLPPEVVATIGAYNSAHIKALNPLGALGTIRRTQGIMA